MTNIIRWDPFKEIERFFSDDFFPALLPTVRLPEIPVDIYEKDNKLYVEVGLPGLSKDDVKIRIKDDLLTIEGTKEEKKEEKDENYYRREIKRGSFKRVIRLPYQINEKEAKAEFSNGILKISFPKAEENEGKEIKIS
ncbi:MAG: Hsp20/alpha crystallin family protein [Patescibacteria group bacterium]|nr:Hsp20/alpha crystallin family protein [Patescibacteria group bacterium]